MKVNGIMIREALKRWEMRREAVVRQFSPSFMAKPTEIAKGSHTTPESVMEEFSKAEDAIATLQALQARYNLDTTVTVSFDNKNIKMSLTEAVKRIGGAGRAENMWRKACEEPEDRFEHQKLMYADKNFEWPTRTMTLKAILVKAATAAAYAGALRGAIAQGNTRDMDMEVNSSLFE